MIVDRGLLVLEQRCNVNSITEAIYAAFFEAGEFDGQADIDAEVFMNTLERHGYTIVPTEELRFE